MEDVLTQIQECILRFDRRTIQEKVLAAIRAGIDPEAILKDGLIAAMGEVGHRFEKGEFFVPELLIAAETMETGLAVLQPHLVQTGMKPAGTIIIGTVQGDLHDVGKNLVAMMLRGSGFEVIDLGTDISPRHFVEAVKSRKVAIVALSALLTTTMVAMKSTVLALEEAGLRSCIKIMVGGAPLTSVYAKEIGADGYASDASSAVRLAKSLVTEGLDDR